MLHEVQLVERIEHVLQFELQGSQMWSDELANVVLGQEAASTQVG